MDRKLIELGACIVALAMSAMAQTNVTNSNNGTTNTVPVYTGTATLGNSPISVSGSNVGIGITSPTLQFQVGNFFAAASEGAGSVVVLPAGNYMRFATMTQELMRLLSNGNFGIGTTAPGSKLEINGTVTLTSGSGASLIFADGTKQTTAWTGVLCGGDYAEAVEATGSKTAYEPGDVLVISASDDKDVQKSNEAYSTTVAGIYATKPGVVGKRKSLSTLADDIPMAMVGIVPTKVSAENGPIHRGDLLVTSSRAGYAMKGTDRGRMLGAVIGKSMGTLESGTGTIEVLVTLQ